MRGRVTGKHVFTGRFLKDLNTEQHVELVPHAESRHDRKARLAGNFALAHEAWALAPADVKEEA
eukprot:1973594-Alexandrium_andersonii.AAC.1